MDTNNTPKANWIHHVNTEEGRIYVSDKGAIKIVTRDQNGQEKFVACFRPREAKLLANMSGDLGNLLISPEYKAIEDNKGAVQEQAKIARQMDKERSKALLQAQAALEQLQRLGVKFELPKVG
jgi:hypothetical protein